MMNTPERRGFTRAHVEVEAIAQFEGGGTVRGRVSDLSLSGVAIEAECLSFAGQDCTVQLVLQGGAEDVPITAKGRVVRADKATLVIEFVAIGADSLGHLERLVLMNAKNPGQVDEEIGQSLGIKRREDG